MKTLLLFFILLLSENVVAQSEINWLSFERLEKVHLQTPKPILIYFYADWCVYCKKMERNAFKNKQVIKKLSQDYYVVKMNAETTDTIVFDKVSYYNNEVDLKRKPTHQLAKLLASRKNKPFSLPAIIVLDKNFKLIKREFTYLTSTDLLRLL